MGNTTDCFLISRDVLKRLKENEISLEEYFILYSKFYKTKWLTAYKPSENSYKSLIDRKILTSSKTISSGGFELFGKLIASETKVTAEQFKVFWETYPRNDGYKHHPMTRSIREKPKECYVVLNNIISQGSHTFEQILNALRAEVKSRQLETNRTGKNALKWIKSPYRWLSDGIYLNWIQTSKKKPKKNVTIK